MEDCEIITDTFYHMKTYKQIFQGSELVNWLIVQVSQRVTVAMD